MNAAVITATNSTADAIVIGGGLHGCSAALHLARAGASVIVLDKDHVGRHASGVNAGGVRTLGRDYAEVPLSVASMALWHRIGELVGDDCGFHSHGQIEVAETEEEWVAQQERVRTLRQSGHLHEEAIGADDLRREVPALSHHCVGAIVARRDGAANPYRTCLAFRRAAAERGVRFHEGVEARSIQRRGGSPWQVSTGNGDLFEAPVLVNCAGAWGDRFAAMAGEPVPLKAIAPMLMITARLPPFLRPVVGAAARLLSFKQFPNGTVLIGGGHLGTADRNGNRTTLDFARLAENAETACDLFPHMRKATLIRAWAGLEAQMPDHLPVIGASGTQEGLFHAFGFSAHGFQLGPIVGSILADLVTKATTELPIAPFHIGRFGKNVPVAERAAKE